MGVIMDSLKRRRIVRRPVLTGVSLAAIIRDEMINPAGGIIDFVESTVPFVEEAVIVDTGSVDGTRETLDKLSVQYPNLRIFGHTFTTYADARNVSLGKVQTPKVLVLDADERLTKADFKILKDFLPQNPGDGYWFGFLDIYPDNLAFPSSGHNPRIFGVSPQRHFASRTWEQLCHEEGFTTVDAPVEIKHFRPDEIAKYSKRHDWYGEIVFREGYDGRPPASCPSFQTWKQPHLKKVRNKYR